MTDKSFTLFEVHLHDGLSFSATNTAPAIGDSDDDTEAIESDEAVAVEVDDEDTTESTDESGGKGLAVLIGLVLVAGLAFAAAKLMGGDDLEELEELDDLSAEA